MDFNLDGCAPTPFSISTISLCNIQTELGTPAFNTLFNINWTLDLGNNKTVVLGKKLRLFNVIASNNALFPLKGTNFPDLGTYVIQLMIDYNGTRFNYGTTTVSNNGVRLSATNNMTLYIVNVSTPPILALFGLGFGFAAYMRRKKAQKKGLSKREAQV